MSSPAISDLEFSGVQKFISDHAGIALADNKKPMVMSRLGRRLVANKVSSYTSYLQILRNAKHRDELQIAIDLLTTNETYFFRETAHFDFLHKILLSRAGTGGKTRVWSAACSAGQEPYSIAMTLAHTLGRRSWEVFATDISTQVLKTAQTGLYPMREADKIPLEFLRKYCRKGVEENEGTLKVCDEIRNRVHFRHVNINKPLPDIGLFDVVFLRNVMIYFDHATKMNLIKNIRERIKPNGYLFIGHSETLNNIYSGFTQLSPSIFQNTACHEKN